MRMTGMRIAQTRGGKRSWRGWPWSTKGLSEEKFVSQERMANGEERGGNRKEGKKYHE